MSNHDDVNLPPLTMGEIAEGPSVPPAAHMQRDRPTRLDDGTVPPQPAEPPKRYAVASMRELFAIEDEPTPWLVQRFIPLDDVTVLLAHPKAGKTWVATELGIAVAFGVPAFGYMPTKTGPVLLWLAEDAAGNMKSRVRSLLRTRGIYEDDPRLDRLHIHTRNLDRVMAGVDRVRLDVTDTRSRELFIAHAKTIKPVLVVLDTMMTVAEAEDENSSSVMQKIWRYLREIRDELGCSLLVTHHFGKDNDTNKDRDIFQRARGSSATRGAWDGAFALDPMKKAEGEDAQRFKVHFEMRGVSGGDPMTVAFKMEKDFDGRATSAAWSVVQDDTKKRTQDEAGAAFEGDARDVVEWFQKAARKNAAETFSAAEVAAKMKKQASRTKTIIQDLAEKRGVLECHPGPRVDSKTYRLKPKDTPGTEET